MFNIVKFLSQTKVELSKVTWPTKKETIELTQVVVLVSLLISVYLGGLDFLYSYLVASLLIR